MARPPLYAQSLVKRATVTIVLERINAHNRWHYLVVGQADDMLSVEVHFLSIFVENFN
jgi:hypothetical protein